MGVSLPNHWKKLLSPVWGGAVKNFGAKAMSTAKSTFNSLRRDVENQSSQFPNPSAGHFPILDSKTSMPVSPPVGAQPLPSKFDYTVGASAQEVEAGRRFGGLTSPYYQKAPLEVRQQIAQQMNNMTDGYNTQGMRLGMVKPTMAEHTWTNPPGTSPVYPAGRPKWEGETEFKPGMEIRPMPNVVMYQGELQLLAYRGVSGPNPVRSLTEPNPNSIHGGEQFRIEDYKSFVEVTFTFSYAGPKDAKWAAFDLLKKEEEKKYTLREETLRRVRNMEIHAIVAETKPQAPGTKKPTPPMDKAPE